MGILSGPEIKRQMRLGSIGIEPFDESRLGPNSYDVCLGGSLLRMLDHTFDLTRPVTSEKIPLMEGGYTLIPGTGYLGSTVERIWSHGFVPWIDGRSTLGRYFVQCHQTAGRADDGWDGVLTLEMVATFRPVTIYPYMPIFQVTFFSLIGERKPYAGRYGGHTGPQMPKPFLR